MPATVVQTASNQNGGGATTLDLAFLAAPTAGNLMVAAITVRGGTGVTITEPTGWTLLRRINNGTTLALAIYTRVNQTGAASTYTWTFSAAQKASGGIREITGQHATTPVAVENGGINASATTHTTVAITAPPGPHLVSASFGTATGTTGLEAAGWTEGYDQATSGGSTGTRTTSEGQSRDADGVSVSGSVVWGAAAVGVSHIMAIASAPPPTTIDTATVTGAATSGVDVAVVATPVGPVLRSQAVNGLSGVNSIGVTGMATQAGSLLVALIGVGTSNVAPISTVTDSASNTWTFLGAGYQGTVSSRIELWYTANAAAVTSVTATNGTTTTTRTHTINVSEWTGVATSAPVDVSATGGGTTTSQTSPSVTPSTGVANALFIAANWSFQTTGNTVTLDAGDDTALTDFDVSGTAYGRAAYRIGAAAGTAEIASWTFATADDAGHIAAIFKAASETGPPPINTATFTEVATSTLDAVANLSATTTSDAAISTLAADATLDAGTIAALATSVASVEKTNADAIAFDSASSGFAAASTITFPHTVGAGSNRFLVVGVSTGSVAVSGVTYGGVAMSLAGDVANGTSARSTVYTLVAPLSGVANVVVTLSASAYAAAGSASWTGVDQATPMGTLVSATGTSTAPTVPGTSAPGEVVHDALASRSTTASVDAGQTLRWDQATASVGTTYFRSSGSTAPGAASVPMSYTLSNSGAWAIVAVPIKPAATGPPPIDTTTITGAATSTLDTAASLSALTTSNAATSTLAANATLDTGTIADLATGAASVAKTNAVASETTTNPIPSTLDVAASLDAATVTNAASSAFGIDASPDAQTTATVAASSLSTTATLDVGTTTDLATSVTTVETIDAIASATTAIPATSSVDVAASLDAATVTDAAASSAASDASLDTQTLTTTATSAPTATSDTPISTQTTAGLATSALSIAVDAATATTANPVMTGAATDATVDTATTTGLGTSAPTVAATVPIATQTTTSAAASATSLAAEVATATTVDPAITATSIAVTTDTTTVTGLATSAFDATSDTPVSSATISGQATTANVTSATVTTDTAASSPDNALAVDVVATAATIATSVGTSWDTLALTTIETMGALAVSTVRVETIEALASTTIAATSISTFSVVIIEAAIARRTFLAYRDAATFTAGRTTTGTLVAARTPRTFDGSGP